MEIIKSELESCEIVVEGQFVSVEQMQEWGFSESLVFMFLFYTVLVDLPFPSVPNKDLPFIRLRQRIEAIKKFCRSQPQKLLRPVPNTSHCSLVCPVVCVMPACLLLLELNFGTSPVELIIERLLYDCDRWTISMSCLAGRIPMRIAASTTSKWQ